MTCCDTGGGWESRVPQATQRQYRKTRLGLSSAVGMDCNELLAEWTLDVGSVVESCAWSWGKVRDPTPTSNAKDGQRGPETYQIPLDKNRKPPKALREASATERPLLRKGVYP
jgi:hypothetical protein